MLSLIALLSNLILWCSVPSNRAITHPSLSPQIGWIRAAKTCMPYFERYFTSLSLTVFFTANSQWFCNQLSAEVMEDCQRESVTAGNGRTSYGMEGATL